MKNLSKIVLIILPFTLFFACQITRQNSNIAINTSDKQFYKAVGVVKKVDVENNRMTIDHEDIKGYMSAMEMDFFVSSKGLFSTLKIGDKVDFEIERTGSDLLITKITKIGEVAILNGTEIYKTNCASCHGDTGEGTKKGIPLISGHALHHTEAEHIKQVTDGEGKKMPAFKHKLTAEEIAEVVEFVRNDLQKNVQREDSHKHKH